MPALRADKLDRGAWFAHALGRIECERYGISDPLESVPADARQAAGVPRMGRRGAAERLKLAAYLLGHADRVWPDRYFREFLGDLKPEVGASDDVDADIVGIADVVADAARAESLRLDLLDLLAQIGDLPAAAEDPLVGVMDDIDDALSLSAAYVLAGQPGAHDGTAALSLLRRHQAPVSALSQHACEPYAQTRELLVSTLAERLRGDDWGDAADAAERLGCLADPRTVQPLLDALVHPSWEVQLEVVQALTRYLDKEPAIRVALAQVAVELGMRHYVEHTMAILARAAL